MSDITVSFKTTCSFNIKRDLTPGEYAALLDSIIGQMNKYEHQHWAETTPYVNAIKEAFQ